MSAARSVHTAALNKWQKMLQKNLFVQQHGVLNDDGMICVYDDVEQKQCKSSQIARHNTRSMILHEF